MPEPLVVEWDWQLRARCRSLPVEAFFAPDGLRGHTLRYFEEDAKAICARCPVLARCRDYALDSEEPYGVWGGLTASERTVLRQRSA